MVAALTTADLLSAVEADLLLPSTDGRLTDAEKLAMANRVMRTVVGELSLSQRSQLWVRASPDTSIVSGTSLYSVPQRAHGETVSDIVIVDGTTEWSAPEIPESQAWRYRTAHGGWDSPYAFTWRDDRVDLLPAPTVTQYSLRFLYPFRPSRLVTVASCALVSSTAGTAITTAATVPTAWASSETVDIVNGTNGRPRGFDQAGTSIATTNVTIAAGIPTGTAAGDYVCLDGETCVPPMSSLMFDALVAGTSVEVARALEDREGVLDAEKRLTVCRKLVQAQINPRAKGARKVLVPHHAPHRRGWRMR